eukprot:TRINITY_DN8018_c0_g1_i1.p1 TRINITY_DN8018_c0_g1~~TRINITY_DN8018_c0_g1_i1.p1  ORF type:complete len:316 (+),score=117.72 TRINITY_DN8018_c0_g1_i1:70-948(+)
MARKIEDHYQLVKEIGKGAFSIVYLIKKKSTGESFAVKIIDKQAASNADTDEAKLKQEVEILKRAKHPNIVQLIDEFETPQKLYLVMELVTGGELFDKLVEKGQYQEKDAALIVRKIVSAIAYLHSVGIAHRDLKPENLLLKSGDDTEVMLSDFGLSKLFGEEQIMKTACGTPYYVAPEVLNATGYDKEVDLWSIGVITYLLLCGYPPFYGESLPEVFEQIMKGHFEFNSPYWDNISSEAKDFIKKLLLVDSKKRLTADNALQHPWLRSGGSTSKLDIRAHLTKTMSKKTFQ